MQKNINIKYYFCALEYTAKFFFGEAAAMSLLQKKSDTRALQVYVIKETTGNILRSEL